VLHFSANPCLSAAMPLKRTMDRSRSYTQPKSHDRMVSGMRYLPNYGDGNQPNLFSTDDLFNRPVRGIVLFETRLHLPSGSVGLSPNAGPGGKREDAALITKICTILQNDAGPAALTPPAVTPTSAIRALRRHVLAVSSCWRRPTRPLARD
jgi:hypothetical protein